MPTNGNYVIRITGDVVANHTYELSTYYIRFRRQWSKGSKIILLRKMAVTDDEDVFISLDTIEKTFEPFELEFVEIKCALKTTIVRK